MYYLHGGLMLVSWGTLLPAGVVAAGCRHVVGERWFKLHRAVNVLGLLLAIAGWAVAVGRTSAHLHGGARRASALQTQQFPLSRSIQESRWPWS